MQKALSNYMESRTFTLPDGAEVEVYQKTHFGIVEDALLPLRSFIELVDNEALERPRDEYVALRIVDLFTLLLNKARQDVESSFKEISGKAGTTWATYAAHRQPKIEGGTFLDAQIEPPPKSAPNGEEGGERQ
ncbi:MAG: hypothetical protein WAW37_14260 [Syntrophobacteraceae bacterium]